jgi:hypothetical protein
MNAETSPRFNWVVHVVTRLAALRTLLQERGLAKSTQAHAILLENCICLRRVVSLLVLAATGLLPALATADSPVFATAQGDRWEFAATLYGWFPSVNGTVHFPVPGTTSNISVDSNQIYSNVNLGATGAFDVHYGRWGAFTDIIYLNLGDKKSHTRDFSIDNAEIPASTTAFLQGTLKVWIVTFAPQYRIVADGDWTVDLLAGARYTDITTTLSWSFTGDIGPLPPASRIGGAEAGVRVWTGIGGVKGQYAFGTDRRWSVPFYFDGGSGDSMRTYQAVGGVAYSFHWGEITALWRYLDYKPQSAPRIEEIYLSGPLIGATFRW